MRRGATGVSGPVAGALFGVGLTVVGIGAAFFLKHPCLFQEQRPRGYAYRVNCYSDIIALYGKRHERFNPPERPVPFSEHGRAYRDNNFEYPALTGLFVSGVNALAPANDLPAFFGRNAAGLALFGLAGAAALGAIVKDRKRLVMYALGPTMIAYALHNWDLLPVGLLAIGMMCFARGHDGAAGLMLGLGAAAKIFPGIALPAFVLARCKRREWAGAATLVVLAAAGFLIPNLIVMGYAPQDGFWFPWTFQSIRMPNPETGWYFIARHASGATRLYDFAADGYARYTQGFSIALFLIGSGWMLVAELRREVFRPFATALGCIAIFILTAKVFSVQYMIWLLPLFVAVRIPWHAWAAYSLTDMLALSAIWGLGVAYIDKTNPAGYFAALEIAVWVRYAAIIYVLWWSRRTSELIDVRSPRAWITSRVFASARRSS